MSDSLTPTQIVWPDPETSLTPTQIVSSDPENSLTPTKIVSSPAEVILKIPRVFIKTNKISPKRRKTAEPSPILPPLLDNKITFELQRDDIIQKLLHKLEFDQKVLSTDHNNQITLKVNDHEILTNISANLFLKNLKTIIKSNRGDHIIFPDHTIISSDLTDFIRFIFLKKYSQKQKELKIKIFYIPPEAGSKGDYTEYKTINEVGTNKIKGYKQSITVRDNFYVNQEHSSLQHLHKILPIDSSLDSKGLKHLGIQDEYKFAQVNVRDHSYVVGTPFEGNIANLKLQGIRTLGVLYQIAFALKIFHDNDLFNHSIKPSNVLFSYDENFPLGGIKVVLSDLHVTTKEQLLENCRNKELYHPPFGCSSDYKFQPDTDYEKMNNYHEKIKECYEVNTKFQQTFEAIVNLRQKNMISLVGQIFFEVMTHYSDTKKWPNEFISDNNPKGLIDKILKNTLYKQNSKMESEGLSHEKRKSFFSEITKMIFHMTNLNHNKRPTADEVLEKLLAMMKNYSPSDYEIIVKNRWTNGYADWK